MKKLGQKRSLDKDLKYQKAFGERVKDLREKLAWVQGDLAVSSGVSETQISVIENGHESPQLHTLKAIALALGKTPSQLLDFPYELKINTNFRKGKIRKTGVTSHIKKLHSDGFFRSQRSVNDVIAQCKKKFNLDFRSAETSGALLLLVNAKQLKKVILSKNRNLYQNL